MAEKLIINCPETGWTEVTKGKLHDGDLVNETKRHGDAQGHIHKQISTIGQRV